MTGPHLLVISLIPVGDRRARTRETPKCVCACSWAHHFLPLIVAILSISLLSSYLTALLSTDIPSFADLKFSLRYCFVYLGDAESERVKLPKDVSSCTIPPTPTRPGTPVPRLSATYAYPSLLALAALVVMVRLDGSMQVESPQMHACTRVTDGVEAILGILRGMSEGRHAYGGGEGPCYLWGRSLRSSRLYLSLLWLCHPAYSIFTFPLDAAAPSPADARNTFLRGRRCCCGCMMNGLCLRRGSRRVERDMGRCRILAMDGG
ncbi:hypothetical protein R3P38DRAFT_3170658 [Favolaschia claudopus]|uniref:Uncharacterized protein n=1 Tax=Favolaschia claudopus TaxID=2862362 RepID=A0AAW0DWJ9_9AGAR